MLHTDCLVLNRSYFPIHVTTVRRAFCMLYQGIVKAVNEEYETYTFDDWAELAAEAHHDTVGVVGRVIRVPRVVLLVAFDRLPKRGIRFSRINILLRDRHRCQYCGRQLPRIDLNLDHVTPRSLGGLTTWENVVTSCHTCNLRKGGRSPEAAGMQLIRKPFRPSSVPFVDLSLKRLRYAEWKPYLNVVDFSYWNVELLP
ncbi:MAG: HNH endonuclease [Deltaproteobacteria bacterium]|nr:HNH endonuclease [Deltaproteobacteria bacterium]